MQTESFDFNVEKILGSIYVKDGGYRAHENELLEVATKIEQYGTFLNVPRNAQFREVVDVHYGFYSNFEELVLEAMYRQWRIREPREEGNEINTNFGAHVAHFLQNKGTIVDIQPSNYNWRGGGHRSYQELSKARIVGIYDIKELFWYEFDGTFVEDSEHTGIQAYMVTHTGFERYVRYEGLLAEVLAYSPE